VYYYHGDHLGSAQVVTDYRGEVYEHIEYTPYGELWVEHAPNVEATPFRFTGKERDSETGLYYYGARYLNPQTGMWLSTDPAMGEYIPQAPINDEARKYNQNLPGMGGVFNTVNLHVYHYAGNNPVRYTDPTGEASLGALLLIAAKANVINSVAKKYNIDPLSIAIILYQENYRGTGTVKIKDFIGLIYYDRQVQVNDSTHSTYSPGIGQIQLRRAAELLGVDINKAGIKKMLNDLLLNDDFSIDLIGANIIYEQKLLGHEINREEAGFVHNMGSSGYQRYLNNEPDKPSDRIPRRAIPDIELIEEALEGKVDPALWF
jgi:RHS repeat-associated protein